MFQSRPDSFRRQRASINSPRVGSSIGYSLVRKFDGLIFVSSSFPTPTFGRDINNSMYVCMYGHHFQQSMDRPGMVANSARSWSAQQENESAPENLVSQKRLDRPIPRQVNSLLLHTRAESVNVNVNVNVNGA